MRASMVKGSTKACTTRDLHEPLSPPTKWIVGRYHISSVRSGATRTLPLHDEELDRLLRAHSFSLRRSAIFVPEAGHDALSRGGAVGASGRGAVCTPRMVLRSVAPRSAWRFLLNGSPD
ncbi:hypothetical protein ACCO45_000002 [Purpureocillium lilacinum]|uniref:Uncharacterized protein n=2 Tax=Purpureocillium lilacinum TaxID=33203 RepID=A0ACC4DJU9_PURLI